MRTIVAKQPWLLILLLILLVPSLQIAATTYEWHYKVRPPVSLPVAHGLAARAINDEASFCIDASLVGNKEGTPSPGHWTLLFSNGNGEQHYVYVDMESHVSVERVLHKAPPGDSRIASSTDALRVLPEFLKSQRIDGTVMMVNDVVVVNVKSRTFQVHELREDGEFSETLQTITGPSRNGFVVYIQQQAAEYRLPTQHNVQSPYFARASNRFASSEKGMSLSVVIEYGHAVPIELVSRVLGLFGSPLTD